MDSVFVSELIINNTKYNQQNKWGCDSIDKDKTLFISGRELTNYPAVYILYIYLF